MRLLLVAMIVAILTGCEYTTTAIDIRLANEACAVHDGVYAVQHNGFYCDRVVCNDGLAANLPNRAGCGQINERARD